MAEKRMDAPPASKGKVIFRPWRIDPKSGQKIWVKTYGFKAWPIPVDDDN